MHQTEDEEGKSRTREGGKMPVGLCAEFRVCTEGEGASDDPLNVGVDVWTELLEVSGANSHQNPKLCSLVGETGNHFNSINSIYGLKQAHSEMKVGACWLMSRALIRTSTFATVR